MPGLTALASGPRLLARRSVLRSRTSPATLDIVANEGRLGARRIATSPTLKLEWEPGLAQLIDRLPLTDDRHVVNDKQLIDQAGRFHDNLEIYEAMAMQLKYQAMTCEGEVLAILKENMDVVKWNHGPSESSQESDVEGKWPKLVEKMNLIAKTRDQKYELLRPSQKDEKEQHSPEEVAKDEGAADLKSSLHLLSKQLKALKSIEDETMESCKILHEGIQGFAKILGVDIGPVKVCKIFCVFSMPSSPSNSRQAMSQSPPYRLPLRGESQFYVICPLACFLWTLRSGRLLDQ